MSGHTPESALSDVLLETGVGEIRRQTDGLAESIVEELQAKGFVIIDAPVCVGCGKNIRRDHGHHVYRTVSGEPCHGVCAPSEKETR